MKLIIDIPDNEYKQNRCYYDSVYHGIPLDDIKAEIEEHVFVNQSLNVDRARALCWCLDVIDKHIGKTESEG